jgi:hypothetical protein
MKKNVFITTMFLCIVTVTQSQVSKTVKSTTQVHSAAQSQPQTQTQAQTQTQTYQSPKNQVQQGSQVMKMKFTPMPKKVNFIRYTKILNAPLRSSNTMDYQTTMPNNKQASSSVNNQQDRVHTTSKQVSSTSSSYMSSTTAYASEYYSKSKIIGGHKVVYYLTSQINGWPQDQTLVKPNIIRKQPAPNPDNQWNCNTVTVSVDAQSTSFMNALPERQASALVPGMIYSFDDFFSGNFNQKYNFNRSPIELVSDVYNSKYGVTSNVNDPNLGSISNGISSIVSQYTPLQAHGDYKVQTLLTDNQSDQDIIVTTGGAYGGFSGTNSFHHTENDHHFYFTISAVKELYTISVQPGQNGYYQGGNIPSSGSPLVMIQSVTYGARVLANMDVAIQSTSNVDGLQLKYDDGVNNANIDLNTLFSNNSVSISINGYLVGFPARFPASFAATKDNFINMLNQFFSGCDYQSAAPIEYGFVNMSGNVMGVASATDQFTIPECLPATDIFTLQSIYASIQTGPDGKNSNSSIQILLTGNDSTNTEKLISGFNNNSTEYRSNSRNDFQYLFTANIPPDHPNGFTMDDFVNGYNLHFDFSHGVSDLFITGDDWDISTMQITLLFKSQKGIPKQVVIKTPNFRLSQHGSSDDDKKDFFFNSDGTMKNQ